MLKNNYTFSDSNWGVTIAVTHHSNFDILTWLELDREFNYRPNRVFLRSNSGVVIDSNGEVVDLELTGKCEASLQVIDETSATITLASASAKELKVGGLSFGGRTVISTRKPSLVEWTFKEDER